MKRIEVTRGGCGIKYTDAKGNVRHELKTAQSGPFECDDMQAARLVELGVAAYVDEEDEEELDDWYPTDASEQDHEPDAQSKPETEEEELEELELATQSEPEKVYGHLDAADLETWGYNELKKLAADMGVKYVGLKKTDLIAAIVAVEVEMGPEMEPVDEEEELEELDPENELPELGAADPE